MACRDVEKCDKACKEIMMETANKSIQCRKLDLASFASIRAFAKLVKSSELHKVERKRVRRESQKSE